MVYLLSPLVIDERWRLEMSQQENVVRTQVCMNEMIIDKLISEIIQYEDNYYIDDAYVRTMLYTKLYIYIYIYIYNVCVCVFIVSCMLVYICAHVYVHFSIYILVFIRLNNTNGTMVHACVCLLLLVCFVYVYVGFSIYICVFFPLITAKTTYSHYLNKVNTGSGNNNSNIS